jgi:AAA+ superfamily predicted ATPase
MNTANFNKILGRETIYNHIKQFLQAFQQNKKDLTFKRGIYIYGAPGTGKTEFVNRLLKELNYDIIKYDAGDIRNKSIIDSITQHNISDKNIMSVFQKKVQKIVIVMDELDGMNNGDKGGITSLIKLIRPKKTKKQKQEEITMNPIICIGNYHIDKKIKELMKVCHVYELKTPTPQQMNQLIDISIPKVDTLLRKNVVSFIQGNLRKLNSITEKNLKHHEILKTNILQAIFQPKTYNEDSKKITQKLINTPFAICEHNNLINETDRTIIGLLWHENIIDVLEKFPISESIPFYQIVLDNICLADYFDRITFQKQIWLFNELCSLIKTFYNNHLYHQAFAKKPKFNPTEVRFTKVLTKYSTEYNNSIFIQNLCMQLSMDQKDMFAFFLTLRKQYSEDEIPRLLETYEITKLDINRIYRYLDKYLLNAVESESKINSNANEINNCFGNDNDNGNGNDNDNGVDINVYSTMNTNPDNSDNDD